MAVCVLLAHWSRRWILRFGPCGDGRVDDDLEVLGQWGGRLYDDAILGAHGARGYGRQRQH